MDEVKVVYKVILFWNQNEDVPQDYITQGSHKNVVVQSGPINLPVPEPVKKAIASLDVYKDTLRRVLSNREYNEKFLKTVMRQVAHGVDHLHKCGRLFGPLTQDEVFICCRRTTEEVSIVLHNPSVEMHSEANGEGKKKDIKGLANFFCDLLTKSKTSDPEQVQKNDLTCSDKGVALHLINTMVTGLVSAQRVLEHPFFWSNNGKIDFICDCFDRVKHIKESAIENIESTIDQIDADIFGDDWIKCLTLEKREITDIQGRLKDKSKRSNDGNLRIKTQVNKHSIEHLAKGEFKHDFSPYICNDTGCLRKFNPNEVNDWTELITNVESGITVSTEVLERYSSNSENVGPILLVKSQEPPYQRDSLFDLLRFFRNRRAHYWECKINVRECLSPYPDGFWRFFSTRFPRLLPFVYENRVKCFHNSA